MNLHNIRTSKITNELIEQHFYFISEIKTTSSSFSRIKTKDFSIIQTIKLLESLSDGEKSFSQLYRVSNFGMKQSFIKYTNLCVTFNFIKKEKFGKNKNSPVLFTLTEKGKIFLDLFRNASS